MNYVDSFALQWERFSADQLDDVNGTSLSACRFAETGWTDLAGKTVLEVGCGAGRFTRLMAKAGAIVTACDLSQAIEICRANNAQFPNVRFVQCDVFALPFRLRSFDRVFCHGVLQHTPDPRVAFMRLAEMVKPGGKLSIDIYHRDGRIRPWKSKYLWRPLTTRIDAGRLLAFLEWFIPLWLPIDTMIKRIPGVGNYLGAVIPCWNYHFTNLTAEQKRRWAVLDTFDALASTYDKPATLSEVREWFEALGWKQWEVHIGGNGLVGNGTAPC